MIAVTPKQKEILIMLRDGKNNKEIAKHFGCSPENISQIIKTIQRKYPELKVWRKKLGKEVIDLDKF